MAYEFGYLVGYSGEEPDFAAVATVVKPLRKKPGGIYQAAAQFGVPGDSVFMTWVRIARDRGYDTGEPRGTK